MFGLLGLNGSGKSSLMRTIATLQQPDSGSLIYDDIDVCKSPQNLRARLGYLPQDFNVYPHVSAYHLLDHMAVLKGIEDNRKRKAAVEDLLHLTNLWSSRKKAVSTYSGGMKQRFGIAIALIADPDLIIVDEPTSGLDPEERQRFLNLLASISENKTVILSTHIVDDVEELCSNMAILIDSKICLDSTPSAAIADLDGQVWRKVIDKDTLQWHKQAFNVISSHLKSRQTVIHVLAEQSPGDGFEMISPDLEDVYFSILHRVRNEFKADNG
jgi:ABC-2 type transport system ATP-binding protein